jgi:hypothetical protein
MSNKAKNAITVIAIILFFPLGIFLMFYWNLYTKWTKIFVCGCLFLFFGTLGFSVWKVSNIIAKVDSLVPTEIAQANNRTVEPIIIEPKKDIFEIADMPVLANGIELNLKSITRQQYTNKIFKEKFNYCAVSFGIKNINANPITISPLNNFILTPIGSNVLFPLSSLVIAALETKPADFESIGESDFELKTGESKIGFIPFECVDFKDFYTFQTDINQFLPEVITGEISYKPIKVKLALSPEEPKKL